MTKIRKYALLVLKGAGMGAANVIPGVSGGTIAFITGIYERLVTAINNFDATALKALGSLKFRELFRHVDGGFLLALISGILLATFSLAGLMTDMLLHHPVQTWAFFFGLIAASSLLIFRGIGKCKPIDFLWIAIGIASGVAVCTMTPVSTPDGLWFIFICGAVSICAMILPGISGSFILLVMGKYTTVMKAIDGVLHFDAASLLTVAVFAIGCVVGLLAFAKFLHWLLGRWNRQTILALAGFVLGSLVKVWPWSNGNTLAEAGLPTEGFPLAGQAILWCIVGAIIVLGLEWLNHLANSGKKH